LLTGQIEEIKGNKKGNGGNITPMKSLPVASYSGKIFFGMAYVGIPGQVLKIKGEGLSFSLFIYNFYRSAFKPDVF
jgi:hypothetical protein